MSRDESTAVLLGEASATALLVALVSSLPAVIRAAHSGVSVLAVLLASGTVLLLLVTPLTLLRERAARGWRGLLGADPPRLLALGVAVWLSTGVVVLTLLAQLLKTRTHHLGLGGATFGLIGLGLVVACALLTVRLMSLGQRLLDRGVSVVSLHIGAAVPLVGLAIAVLSPAFTGGVAGAALLDMVVLMATSAFAMARPWVRRRAALASLPLVVVWLAVGGYRLEAGLGVDAVHRAGGIASVVVKGLEAWSDRDGDGHGAHFGGGDCDEGSALTHPGAEDVAGDGIDRNCDGSDDARPSGVSKAEPAEPEPTPSATVATAPAPASSASRVEPQAPLRAGVQPDIVLVTLDTVRADRTSLYGYQHDTTPSLVKLGKRSVVFEHAYAIASDTQRALAPIVSGRPLSRTPRSAAKWPLINEEANTLAERLKTAGYATAAVTSFTWLRRDRGIGQGFDHFDERPFRASHPERDVTGETAARVAREIYDELAVGAKPVFLWLHLFDPHERYLPHPGIDFGGNRSGLYDGEIAFTDRQLGTFIDHVEASERAARTVWVIHGSHGEGFKEHGYEGHGTELYDEMIRVPLLVAAPGALARRFDSDAVSTLDVAPTVLDFAGASRTDVEGVSLKAAVLRSDAFSRPPVFAHAWRRAVVVDWPLKLMVRRRDNKQERLLLFDLASDPREQHDVSGERSADLTRLQELLSGDS